MHAAVGLDEIVGHQVDVIIVEIDGCRFAVLFRIRRAVSADVDAVVEIGDVIVAHHVARSVHLDRVITLEAGAAIDPGIVPAY